MLTWILNIGGAGGGLGWYHARYNNGQKVFGANADPYPWVSDVVKGANGILDTVTDNW